MSGRRFGNRVMFSVFTYEAQLKVKYVKLYRWLGQTYFVKMKIRLVLKLYKDLKQNKFHSMIFYINSC